MDPFRELPTEEVHEEKDIGGLDMYLIGDKSGSMSSTFEGEQLWQMQRRAAYLIFSSMYRFERNLERAGLQKDHALSVRTQGISFRGGGEIDVDKPLSSDFTAIDKVRMWKSLSNQGAGNGDAEALGSVYAQIKAELRSSKEKIKDDRLRVVIACSDGGYDTEDAAQMQLLAEELHKLNVLVVGIGLTETAVNVPVVMNNPPYSRGEPLENINICR